MQPLDFRDAIKAELAKGVAHSEIARRIYLSYPTFSFEGKPDREFDIKNLISTKFDVDLFSIHFAGSGKTGESYHKKSIFQPGNSDLDAAIISHSLFLKFLEETITVTNGFKDQTTFTGTNEDYELFKKRLCHGIFIPELMPTCTLKSEWMVFFENLSHGNEDLFRDINCWIYSSQKIYEWKFSSTIRLLEKGV